MILAGVVAGLIWLRWGGIRKGIWIDLDVYMRGATAVMHHQSLKSVSVQGQLFTYPPFAAVFFVPLALLGDFGAHWALSVASIGCYVVVVVVVVVCARRLRMNVATAAMVALAGLTVEPFARNMLLCQINLVLLALIVIDCLVVPARYRGMLIGVAAGIKILPGAFILFLVLKREWGLSFAASRPLLSRLGWAPCLLRGTHGSSGAVVSSCPASARVPSFVETTSP